MAEEDATESAPGIGPSAALPEASDVSAAAPDTARPTPPVVGPPMPAQSGYGAFGPGTWAPAGSWGPAAGSLGPAAGSWGPAATAPSPVAAPWPGGGFGLAAYVPPGPEPGFRWGGIGARFGALVIDAVIVIASEIALSLAVTGGGGNSRGSTPAWATAVFVMWWLCALAYHPACWYVFGATPGQKALSLRVVRAYEGAPLSLGAVLVRYLLFFFVTVLFPLGIVSGILAINDPFKRAWHDQVARSVVVKRGYW